MPSGTAVREKIKADSPDALIAQASTEQHERRQRAAEEYRKLLSQGGDEAALRACMGILGRTPADLEGDRELVKQVGAYEQAGEQRAAALAAYEKAKPQLRLVTERVAKRRAALQAELDTLKVEEERATASVRSPLHVAGALERQVLLDRTAMDAWGAIVAGIPLEKWLAGKRRARMAKYEVPPPARFVRTEGRRAEIVVAARDEYRHNELLYLEPVGDKGEIAWVEKHLGQSGETAKLSEEEVKQFALRNRRREERDREERGQRDTDRRKAKLEAGKSTTE